MCQRICSLSSTRQRECKLEVRVNHTGIFSLQTRSSQRIVIPRLQKVTIDPRTSACIRVSRVLFAQHYLAGYREFAFSFPSQCPLRLCGESFLSKNTHPREQKFPGITTERSP